MYYAENQYYIRKSDNRCGRLEVICRGFIFERTYSRGSKIGMILALFFQGGLAYIWAKPSDTLQSRSSNKKRTSQILGLSISAEA